MAVQYILLLASAALISILICSTSAQGPGGSVVLVETPKANVEVDAGSTVYYVCVGYGDDDPPSITWRFGDKVLTNDSTINSALSLVAIYEKPVVLNNVTFTQSILELCSVQTQDDGIYSCSAVSTSNASSTFKLKVKVTSDTIGSTVQNIATQAERSANNPSQQTTQTLAIFDNTLSSVADFVSEANTSVIDVMVVENVVDTINSLLHWTPDSVMAYNISQLVESFETIVSQYAAQIPINEQRTFNSTSLKILSENVAIETLQMSGRNITFGINGLPEVVMTTSGGQSPQQVSLPASLFERINDSSNVGVFYGVYDSSILFPVTARQDTNTERKTQVISNVIAVTVGQNSTTFADLSQPVVIRLRLQKKERMYTTSEMCVSWDFDLQEWTPRGCKTNKMIVDESEVAICECNHLTNFAVLADVCSSAEACSDVLGDLNNLNSTFNNLTDDNYEVAVAMLSRAIGRSENSSIDQNTEVLSSTAEYIDQLATFLNDSMVMISETVTRNVIQVVSSLLQWQPTNIEVRSSSRIIQSFEVVLSLYAQQLPLNETMILNESSSVVLVAERRSVQSLVDDGRRITIAGNEPMTAPNDQVTKVELLSEQEAAIRLPGSLFRLITDAEDIGMTFGFYNESTLFPVGTGSAESRAIAERQTRVGSLIASAIVGLNRDFRNLEDPVTNTFQLQIPPDMYKAPGSEICVFWDFTLQDWNSEGCTTNASVSTGQEGMVTCQCNHLTNFAVLVDICLRQNDCSPSKVETALTFISYIGISISIICLILTIITLVIFEDIRKKDVSKFHIQLSLAILLMLTVALVFVGLSVSSESDMREYGGCVTVSVLLHYFTLVAVIWMGAEAFLMFQKLVIVFVTITKKYIVTVSIICWTVPIIPVLIPMIMDLVNGNKPDDDIVVRREDISFCFLSHVAAFWGAFLGPLLLVMVFNIIIFVCVVVVLIRHLRTSAALKKDAVDKKSIIRLMISLGGVMSIFGLTWLFAILTIRSTPALRETFQILFTLFNSLQGFFIFLFLCVIAADAREEWKKIFSCVKFRSWYTQTSSNFTKGTNLKNSNGTSDTLDSKQINLQFSMDTLPKDKQAMA